MNEIIITIIVLILLLFITLSSINNQKIINIMEKKKN